MVAVGEHTMAPLTPILFVSPIYHLLHGYGVSCCHYCEEQMSRSVAQAGIGELYPTLAESGRGKLG